MGGEPVLQDGHRERAAERRPELAKRVEHPGGGAGQCGVTSREAIVCIGDITQPTPTPATRNPGTKSCQRDPDEAASVIQVIPAAYATKPVTSRYFPYRLAARPANGATTMDASEDGTIVSPALSGLKPSTVCRYRVSGSTMPSRPTDTIRLAPPISA